MNEKQGVNLTGKDAAKLLEGLTKDPQLRSEDDPSILAEEQFPTVHHAMLQGKTIGSSTDNIAMGKAADSSSVGGAEGHVDRAEEQNSQTVSAHCHN